MQHTTSPLLSYFSTLGIVSLITLHSVEEAVPLAQALEEGGVPVAEVTFRSPYAIEGMRRISKHVPNVTLVAGTVHTIEQAEQAIDAGCKALVTPAFDEPIVHWAIEHNVDILPGTAVPTDIEKAYDAGLRYVKFFPAEAYGGVATLKALSGSFGDMKFLPTGGVNLANASEYISLPNVFAIGGSFPVPSAAQQEHNWKGIVEACQQALNIVKPIVSKK